LPGGVGTSPVSGSIIPIGRQTARARWQQCSQLTAISWRTLGSVGAFRPLTQLAHDIGASEGRFELQVESSCKTFRREGALSLFLTLDFQFLHEYISHVLPVWASDSNVFEEVYLFAITYLFNQIQRSPHSIINSSLVVLADQVRNDRNYRRRRLRVENLGDWVGAHHLSRFLLDVAMMEDPEMTPPQKKQLLTLLSKLPHVNEALQKEIEEWIRTLSPADVHHRLRLIYIPDDPRLGSLSSTG
jgi:hypothetical protein